jgi:hypothetical protein
MTTLEPCECGCSDDCCCDVVTYDVSDVERWRRDTTLRRWRHRQFERCLRRREALRDLRPAEPER